MNGIIVSYRRGRNTMRGNQIIVEISGVKNKAQAAKIVGKKAVWKTSSGKKIVGKISGSHGNKGAVKVRFSKGMPGQSIGTKIEILA